jgi:hypothetical protein
MNTTMNLAGAEVTASGWRFYPWGLRLMMVIIAAVLLFYYYLLFGPPVNLFSAAAYSLVLVVVVPLDLFFELQSVRRVRILESGVEFFYMARKLVIPWDRLEYGSLQLPTWCRTVTFLEVRRKSGLSQLARRVSVDQARAILKAMPNPPDDASARKLMESTSST